MVRKGYKETFRKGRVTQAWNALNLYNLAKMIEPYTLSKTFFQQKWASKAVARSYHGKQVREKQWQRMFSRKLPAVQVLDAKSLAYNDGSNRARGRGAGLEEPVMLAKGKPPRRPETTPYMSMTFYPLERRLDTAVFRALFASSVRMARQYVVHGHVRVNGKKMKHPGYLLNPGDMFSVDPELVLLGTGLKDTPQDRFWLQENSPPKATEVTSERKTHRDPKEIFDPEAAKDLSSPTSITESEPTPKRSSPADSLRTKLKKIDNEITHYLRSPAKKGYVFRTRRNDRLFKLRQLRRNVREAIKTASANPPDEATKSVKSASAKLVRIGSRRDTVKAHMQLTSDDLPAEVVRLTHLQLLKSWPNKRLDDKPYMTPWYPRHWMSAFAFIPRYLEVNQNVCSAVYLRDPVARPGWAEVPTPYADGTSLLAYQWYLRRR